MPLFPWCYFVLEFADDLGSLVLFQHLLALSRSLVEQNHLTRV